MTTIESEPLAELYLGDETAWLDAMARLASQGRTADMDLGHLAEFLTDMARRDRREVESRLTVLMAHLLKWQHQPRQRSRSWRLTIEEQRQVLRFDFQSRTLRNHAESRLADVYRDAVERASIETGLAKSEFPSDCPFTLTQLETNPLEGDAAE